MGTISIGFGISNGEGVSLALDGSYGIGFGDIVDGGGVLTLWTPNFNATNSYGDLTTTFTPTGAGTVLTVKGVYKQTTIAAIQQILSPELSAFALTVSAANVISFNLLANVTINGLAATSGVTVLADGYFELVGDLDATADIDIIAANAAFAENYQTQQHFIGMADSYDGVVNGRDVVEQNGVNSYGTIPQITFSDVANARYEMYFIVNAEPSSFGYIIDTRGSSGSGLRALIGVVNGTISLNDCSGYLDGTAIISDVTAYEIGKFHKLELTPNINPTNPDQGVGIGINNAKSLFSGVTISNLSITDLDTASNSRLYPMDTLALTDSIEPVQPELVVNGDFATDSDWAKGTGWTISGGSANSAGDVASSYLSQVALEVGKTYVVEYEVLNYVSGSVRFADSGVLRTANGVYSELYTSPGVTASLKNQGGGFIGSIDNISVKETTTGEWINSPTLVSRENNSIEINTVIRSATMPVETGLYNKLDTTVYPELVVNGDFATDTVWIKGAGWTISGGQAVKAGGGGTFLQQDGILIPTKTYSVEYEVISETGSINIVLGGTFFSGTVNIGINKLVLLCGAGTGFAFQGGNDYVIDNVSVKQTNQIGTLINLGATQPYTPQIKGGAQDRSFEVLKSEQYNGDFDNSPGGDWALGVDTLNSAMTTLEVDGALGSWESSIASASILVANNGAVVKIGGAPVTIINYTTLLGTGAMIQIGFEYPNVFRVLEPDANVNSEYYHYDNGGSYPWIP